MSPFDHTGACARAVQVPGSTNIVRGEVTSATEHVSRVLRGQCLVFITDQVVSITDIQGHAVMFLTDQVVSITDIQGHAVMFLIDQVVSITDIQGHAVMFLIDRVVNSTWMKCLQICSILIGCSASPIENQNTITHLQHTYNT